LQPLPDARILHTHRTLQLTHVPLHDFPQALQPPLQPLMLRLDFAHPLQVCTVTVAHQGVQRRVRQRLKRGCLLRKMPRDLHHIDTP
jgi:hypothetical protein